MERLTYGEGKVCELKACDRCPSDCMGIYEVGKCMVQAVRKLKKYEDTGLTPEECAALKQERDAAVEDIVISGASCETCMFAEEPWSDEPCLHCRENEESMPNNHEWRWQWRGPQREEEPANDQT